MESRTIASSLVGGFVKLRTLEKRALLDEVCGVWFCTVGCFGEPPTIGASWFDVSAMEPSKNSTAFVLGKTGRLAGVLRALTLEVTSKTIHFGHYTLIATENTSALDGVRGRTPLRGDD